MLFPYYFLTCLKILLLKIREQYIFMYHVGWMSLKSGFLNFIDCPFQFNSKQKNLRVFICNSFQDLCNFHNQIAFWKILVASQWNIMSWCWWNHYSDIIMGTMASQITSLRIVHLTVYSGRDQRKHQSSASLAFVWRIHWWLVNSLHKGPVTQKMFPYDDVIMIFITGCTGTYQNDNFLCRQWWNKFHKYNYISISLCVHLFSIARGCTDCPLSFAWMRLIQWSSGSVWWPSKPSGTWLWTNRIIIWGPLHIGAEEQASGPYIV